MDIGTIIEGIELADVLFGALAGSYGLSEVLPHLKTVKANSVSQLCWDALKAIARIFTGNRRKEKQYLD